MRVLSNYEEKLLLDYDAYLQLLESESYNSSSYITNDEAVTWALRWDYLPLINSRDQRRGLSRVEAFEFRNDLNLKKGSTSAAVVSAGSHVTNSKAHGRTADDPENMMRRSQLGIVGDSRNNSESANTNTSGNSGTTTTGFAAVAARDPKAALVVNPVVVATSVSSRIDQNHDNREKLFDNKSQSSSHSNTAGSETAAADALNHDKVIADVYQQVNNMHKIAEDIGSTINNDLKTLERQANRFDENVNNLTTAVSDANALLWANRFGMLYIWLMFLASLLMFAGMTQFIFFTGAVGTTIWTVFLPVTIIQKVVGTVWWVIENLNVMGGGIVGGWLMSSGNSGGSSERGGGGFSSPEL